MTWASIGLVWTYLPRSLWDSKLHWCHKISLGNQSLWGLVSLVEKQG